MQISEKTTACKIETVDLLRFGGTFYGTQVQIEESPDGGMFVVARLADGRMDSERLNVAALGSNQQVIEYVAGVVRNMLEKWRRHEEEIEIGILC